MEKTKADKKKARETTSGSARKGFGGFGDAVKKKVLSVAGGLGETGERIKDLFNLNEEADSESPDAAGATGASGPVAKPGDAEPMAHALRDNAAPSLSQGYAEGNEPDGDALKSAALDEGDSFLGKPMADESPDTEGGSDGNAAARGSMGAESQTPAETVEKAREGGRGGEEDSVKPGKETNVKPEVQALVDHVEKEYPGFLEDNTSESLIKLLSYCLAREYDESRGGLETAQSYQLFITDKVQELLGLAQGSMKIVVKNSSNSGVPTSKDPIGHEGKKGKGKKKPRPGSRDGRGLTEGEKKKPGGQPGRERNMLDGFTEEEAGRVAVHEPEACAKCGSDNIALTGDVIEKDEYEIRICFDKVKHKYYVAECIDCGETFTVPMSDRMKYTPAGKATYAGSVDMAILELRNIGNVALNKIDMLLKAMAGSPLGPTEGYICKAQMKYAHMLEPFRDDCRTVLLQEPVIHWDDTTGSCDGDKIYGRVYASENIALFYVHGHKDMPSLLEDGILQFLTDLQTAVHDHFKGNCNAGFAFRNIECCQHFERALVLVHMMTEHEWALQMHLFMQETIHERNELASQGIMRFSEEQLTEKYSRLLPLIDQGAREHGQMKESDYGFTEENRLLNFIRDYFENLFMWMHMFELPVTNNESESLLRNGLKRFLSITGQFKNDGYADAKCLIETYPKTCRKHDVAPDKALERLVEGNPYTVQELLGVGPDLILPGGIDQARLQLRGAEAEAYWKDKKEELRKAREKREEKRNEKNAAAPKKTPKKKHEERQERYSA